MKESNIENISELMSQHGIPEAAKSIRDIQEIEKDHLLGLLESANIEQFLEESKSVSSDRDFMLRAIKLNGLALEAASEDLKNDKDLVLQAIEHSNYGYALEYASPSLRANKQVVETAALNDIDSIRFADKSLLEDGDFAKTLIQIDPNSLRYLSENLRENSGLVLLAITEKPEAFQYVGKEVRQKVIDLIKAKQNTANTNELESNQDIQVSDDAKETKDFLDLNPIEQIKNLIKSIDHDDIMENISREFIIELYFWIRQLPVRLKNNPEGNFNIATKISNFFDHGSQSSELDLSEAVDFRDRVSDLLNEVESSMEYDSAWLQRPELWKIAKR